MPEAESWEQEPETVPVWLRQRTRWMAGNLYLLRQALRHPEWWRGRVAWFTAELLSVYLVFVLFMLVSDTWFLLGLLWLLGPVPHIPTLEVWAETLIAYMSLMLSGVTADGTFGLDYALLAPVMYFTYSQAWMYILFRGWVRELTARRRPGSVRWEKTVRF